MQRPPRARRPKWSGKSKWLEKYCQRKLCVQLFPIEFCSSVLLLFVVSILFSNGYVHEIVSGNFPRHQLINSRVGDWSTLQTDFQFIFCWLEMTCNISRDIWGVWRCTRDYAGKLRVRNTKRRSLKRKTNKSWSWTLTRYFQPRANGENFSKIARETTLTQCMEWLLATSRICVTTSLPLAQKKSHTHSSKQLATVKISEMVVIWMV